MSKVIDLTNQKFNLLTVISRADNSKDGKAQWLCKCECGNEKMIRGQDLRNGKTQSCGCLQKKRTSEKNLKNRIGQKYGYLTVLRQATLKEKPISNSGQRTSYWICSCSNCGNSYFLASAASLSSGRLNSCGCLTSKNESIISQLLLNNDINYIKEYAPSDLKNKNQLFFDFYINNSYIIEFDGRQHFFSDGGWNTEEKYINTHKSDLIKNKYCFDNNIPLIRIPYDADYTIDDLRLETTRFLLIPENEKEYYESRQ